MRPVPKLLLSTLVIIVIGTGLISTVSGVVMQLEMAHRRRMSLNRRVIRAIMTRMMMNLVLWSRPQEVHRKSQRSKHRKRFPLYVSLVLID